MRVATRDEIMRVLQEVFPDAKPSEIIRATDEIEELLRVLWIK